MERFSLRTFWDHLQTCQTKSVVSQVHDWVVYKLGTLLGSVGHKVKIHNRLPPPHTLITDFTMTVFKFGCSHLHPMGQLTHTRRSDDPPDPDGDLKESDQTQSYFYR